MIKKIVFVLLMILITSLNAKDCPSRLYSNLRQFGNIDLYYGLELKANYYRIGDENYNFFGSSFVMSYETSKAVYNFEMRFEPKKYARHEEGTERSPFKFRAINIDYELSGNFSFIAGRQEIVFGNGLVLDDFFDSFTVYLGKRKRFSAGLGIYSIYSAKEALECQKGFFFNYTNSWKNLRNSDWGDIKLGYMNYNMKFGKNRFEFLLLRIQGDNSNFNSSVFSMSSSIKLRWNWKLSSETAIQFFDDNKNIEYGFDANLYKNFKINNLGKFLTKIRYLYGSSEKTIFTPLFGNIHLGERQHYSVRQGTVFGGELKFTPSFFKKGTLKLEYYRNFRNNETLSDEFDVGLELNIVKSKRIRLLTTYSVWSGVLQGSQIMTNLRIIL